VTLAKQVIDKVVLAQVYFEDGALLSSARCLREAAELLEVKAEEKNDALGIPSPARDAPGAAA